MKKLPLISIIIPVYNTSLYLTRCLNSVLNQTYKNIEIIVIDDGSTDDSLQIIKKFSKVNSNIKVISQKNCGQSYARNAGLELANGKYIMFVDSDDYVNKDFCKVAYNSINNNHAEIAIFDIYRGNDNSFQKVTFNLNNGQISKEEALSTTINASFAVNKIYKASLFKNIKYPVNKQYEDIFTTYKLIDIANGISYIAKPLYYYVQRGNSTVHYFTTQSITSYFEAIQDLFTFLKKNYPTLANKMISILLEGSFYFLAYADKESTPILIEQAKRNLRSLPLQKNMKIKWILLIKLYRCFPKLSLKLFKKNVLN